MKKIATPKDNIVPFSAYPIRPAMFVGESIVGYVTRFCAANNVKVQKELNSLVRSLYLGREMIKNARRVAQIIGESNTLDISGWLMKRFRFMLKKRIPADWNPLTTNFMRYCPICMQQHECHWYCWEMPKFVACPLHGCQLIQFCTTCNKRLIWNKLRGNWSCTCSTSIQAMRVTTATTWKILLAKTILNATDCPSPLHYYHLLGESSINISYTSQEVYDAMYWAHFLGRVLNIRDHYMPQKLRLKELEKVDYQQLGSREVSLMFDHYGQFRRIRALLKLEASRKNLLFITPPNSHFGRVLEVLKDAPTQSNPFIQRLGESLMAFCDTYQLPLSYKDINIFFDPRIKPNQRQIVLNEFADWWFVIANQIAIMPEGTETYCRSYKAYYMSNANRATTIIIGILNRLFELSRTNEPEQSLKRLILRWHVPYTLREKISSTEILNRLMTYFMSISEEEVFYIDRLIQT